VDLVRQEEIEELNSRLELTSKRNKQLQIELQESKKDNDLHVKNLQKFEKELSQVKEELATMSTIQKDHSYFITNVLKRYWDLLKQSSMRDILGIPRQETNSKTSPDIQQAKSLVLMDIQVVGRHLKRLPIIEETDEAIKIIREITTVLNDAAETIEKYGKVYSDTRSPSYAEFLPTLNKLRQEAAERRDSARS